MWAGLRSGAILRKSPVSALWVYGPGGIGKSTLLRAFAEIAQNSGYVVDSYTVVTLDQQQLADAVRTFITSTAGHPR